MDGTGDPSNCGTCGLHWPRTMKHPPCLKLSPEERKRRGAMMAQPDPDAESN